MNPNEPRMLAIELRQRPIACTQIREQVQKNPSFFPHGARCGFCHVDSLLAIEMWPVVLMYQLEPGKFVERWTYCCSLAHASRFMLNWWDEHTGELVQ